MKTHTEISPVQQELFEWAGQDLVLVAAGKTVSGVSRD